MLSGGSMSLLEFGVPSGVSSSDHFDIVCEYINRLGVPNSADYIQKLLTIDYIMGQIDRHYNNIALLHNIHTDTYEMAPLFDSQRTFFAGVPEQFLLENQSIIGKPFGPNGMINLDDQIVNVKTVKLSREGLDKVIIKYRQVLSSVGVSAERIDFLTQLINQRYNNLLRLTNNLL